MTPVRKGGVLLTEGTDQLKFLELTARREATFGLRVEILDRAGLERIAPWLGSQIVGAELCHEEGKLTPHPVPPRGSALESLGNAGRGFQQAWQNVAFHIGSRHPHGWRTDVDCADQTAYGIAQWDCN